MTEQRVTVTITDGVADVRLNRPEKRNALDNAMFAGLITAGERLESEPGVRAVVLSGEGPDFCAGLDFGSFQAMRDGERLSLQVDLPPAQGGGPGHRAARRVRLGRTARPGHRGRDRQRPGRRPADRPRRRHPHRRAGRADVGAGDQVGPDPRHDRQPAAARAGRPGRGQGADLLRPHGERHRGRRAGPGHQGRPRPARRQRSSWPAASPPAARTPSGPPSGCSTWRAGWTWPQASPRNSRRSALSSAARTRSRR